MMGGDSSIYWGNGVGDAPRGVSGGRNDKGSLSSPRSRCVLLLFFCWASCFCWVPCPQSSKLVDDPQTGGKEQTDCFGR